MANFYGTVRGYARTVATRTGHSGITTSAQSYKGSVITRLSYDGNGNLVVEVEASNGSATSGRPMFRGTFEEFKEALKREAAR